MDSATLLLPLVQLRTTGCPENNALYALRKAFADVCRQTECWRDTVNITVATIEEVGTDEERVKVPAPAYAARILLLHRILHERLDGATFDDPADIELAKCRIQTGDSDWLVIRNQGTLAVGDKLALDVSLVPDEIGSTLAELPSGIVKLCGQAAVDSAVAILCRQPGRPWTQPETATLAAMDAANGIRRILADVGSGGMNLPATSIPDAPVEG